MKRHLFYLVSYIMGLFTVAVLPLVTAAYSLEFDPSFGSTKTPLKTYSQLGSKDPGYIVFSVINTGLIFLGMITVVMIIVAGFMWLLAGGVEEKIKKAKDLLQGAVVGLVIVLSSYGLAQFIFTALQRTTSG